MSVRRFGLYFLLLTACSVLGFAQWSPVQAADKPDQDESVRLVRQASREAPIPAIGMAVPSLLGKGFRTRPQVVLTLP